MGAALSYLQRTKSGRLNFRREYPRELRPFIPGSPYELKRSLGREDRGLSERFAKAAAEYEAVITMAKKAAQQIFDPINPLAIEFLKEAVRHQSLADDEAARWDQGERELFATLASQLGAAGLPFAGSYTTASGRNDRLWAKRGETLDIVEAAYRHRLSRGDIAGIVELVGFEVEELTASFGLRFDPSSPEFPSLCRAYVEASLSAIDDMRKRLAGVSVSTPPEPAAQLSSAVPAPVHAVGIGEPLSKTIGRVLSRPGEEAGASTVQSTRTAMRSFIDVNNDIPLAQVTRLHVSQWLDMLRRKPARPSAAEKRLPLPELVEKYRDKDVPRLTGKTAATHLQSLATVWNKARRAGYLPQDMRRDDNPFAEHRVTVAPPAGTKGFSLEELMAIFALPVFTQNDRPVRGKGEAAFWLPLLLLWTGARPEEAAQLLVADIAKDPMLDRWMITFTDEGTHPEKGARTLKTAKTKTGRRTFPIPHELIRIGLINYVESLRTAGELALFPLLRLKGGARRELNAGWTEWWGQYLRKHGLLGDAGSGRQPAREFRHTWTAAARASGIAEEDREYIQGHSTAQKSANVRYGSREAHGLSIDGLEFKGLDLSHIKWSAATHRE